MVLHFHVGEYVAAFLLKVLYITMKDFFCFSPNPKGERCWIEIFYFLLIITVYVETILVQQQYLFYNKRADFLRSTHFLGSVLQW